MVGLSKAAAIDYATQGIRVNAIAPGLVRTPMTERWLNDPQMWDRVLADSPVRRAAEPEDIAGLVLFLASDLANIITGAVGQFTLGPAIAIDRLEPGKLLKIPFIYAVALALTLSGLGVHIRNGSLTPRRWRAA